MSNSKQSRRLTIALCVVCWFSFLTTKTFGAGVTAEQVKNFSDTAKNINYSFMQESFDLRMGYEYDPRSLKPDDQKKLQQMVQKAGGQLATIAEKQRELKKQIEDYDSQDWDEKYGQTGLWRKAAGEVEATVLQKCEIDYYAAIASQGPQRNEILKNILAELEKSQNSNEALKVKVLALLDRGEAEKEFKKSMLRSDVSEELFRIEIERFKFFGAESSQELNVTIEQIAKSNCRDDVELVLSAVFLQRRYDPNGFEKSFSMFPFVQGYVTKLLVKDMPNLIEQELDKRSVFEVELAVRTIWENEAGGYRAFLESLLKNQKFQTALIYYVAAVKLAEDEPKRAVGFLIRASQIQQGQKESRLEVTAEKIAEQACQLGYNLFAKDLANCQIAMDAFENYSRIAKKESYGQLEYLYSVVLDGCGNKEKSRKLLEKLAANGSGIWQSKAKLELIAEKTQQAEPLNETQRSELLAQSKELMVKSVGDDAERKAISLQAKILYCRMLLKSPDANSTSQVWEVLKDEDESNSAVLLLKSKVFIQVGRFDCAAESMAKLADANDGDYTAEGMILLGKVVPEIERYDALRDGEFKQFLNNLRKIAEHCYGRLSDEQGRGAGVYLAELLILKAKSKENLQRAEKILERPAGTEEENDPNFVRCRAELLSVNGEFEQAAKLWSEICQSMKNETTKANERSWQWWRAKYYELCCWSRCPNVNKNEVQHSIEVLENSFENVPEYWGKKINILKNGTQQQSK